MYPLSLAGEGKAFAVIRQFGEVGAVRERYGE